MSPHLTRAPDLWLSTLSAAHKVQGNKRWIFHPFPSSQLPPNSTSQVFPESLRKQTQGCAARRGHLSVRSPCWTRCLPTAVSGAPVGRGCLSPKPPGFSPAASPSLQPLASLLYKSQGSSLLILTPFSLSLLSSAVAGERWREGRNCSARCLLL